MSKCQMPHPVYGSLTDCFAKRLITDENNDTRNVVSNEIFNDAENFHKQVKLKDN